jgi:hypothetical protein
MKFHRKLFGTSLPNLAPNEIFLENGKDKIDFNEKL